MVKTSRKKKIFVTISGVILVLAMILSQNSGECTYSKEINVTYNVTVPISVCDIGPTINCYRSSYIKEVTELKNVTFTESCKLVKK